MSNHEACIAPPDEIVPDARILAVDDNDILRGLHDAVLSLAGYGAQSAADGEEALVMLAMCDFDLVLTDLNMPRLDGFGLIRTLRAAGSRIPVMMVSGSLANGGELPADVRREVAMALPKPLKTGELLAGIALVLGSQPAAPRPTRIADVFPAAAPRKTHIADLFTVSAT